MTVGEKKRVVFLTGTRADFGKLKTLIKRVDDSPLFDCHVMVTGLHMLSVYGSTHWEVSKQEFSNVHKFINQSSECKMDTVLANTITSLSHYMKEIDPDLIVVHGDRVEPLAGAMVAAFNNYLLAHVEGGEVSGNIDESIRHAISKFAQVHFVANDVAKDRLVRMGENKDNIFIIGSPDIDVMLSDSLPSLADVKKYYEIPFADYHVFTYHPVTSETEKLRDNVREVISGLKSSGEKFVVIYPNNDEGSAIVLDEIRKLEGDASFRVLPSMRFESFLTLLKHARSIVGNSSAGIRESEIYGVPSVNIGTRQTGRSSSDHIINVVEDALLVREAIKNVSKVNCESQFSFGDGNSTEQFMKVLEKGNIFELEKQKYFCD